MELRLNTNNTIIEKIGGVAEFVGLCNKTLKELRIILFNNRINITNEEERNTLIEKYHNDPLLGAHSGPTRMYEKLRQKYAWTKMRKHIFEFTKKCIKCQMNKAQAKPKHKFEITDTPTRAFDLIEIDTVGPLPTDNDFKYILTIQCQLTKYVIAAPMKDKTALSVARCIFENFIYLHGFPKCILTDNGLEYKNEVLKEINQICNIEHRFSTPYRPQTIGSLERNHRVLNDYLRNYMNQERSNWVNLLKCYVFAWNSTPTPHLSNFSPYYLVYGKS